MMFMDIREGDKGTSIRLFVESYTKDNKPFVLRGCRELAVSL